MKPRLKPRDYQLEALRWALSRERAIVCMPTGAGKTLIAALWILELVQRGEARKVLVLEPTRFLVEQTSRVLRSLGIPAEPVHGSMSRRSRARGWRARVVVATPEIVESEGFDSMEEPDAIVVDECHHTTGQDSYVKVASRYRPRWRLGLTAYVPPSRRSMLEEYIGEVRCWSWSDPRLAKYIPEWVGEVYEAPLNDAEKRLYEVLEDLWDSLQGRERVVAGNAVRWLVRDGAEAVRESYKKGGMLSRILKPLEDLIFDPAVRPAHKLPALLRALADHEGFEKAIVFVDRVAIARIIAREAADYRPALLLGRRHLDPAAALEAARRRETRLVIATSAGEESIDLPEADLLVVWSHTASPLRFIQRLGRILRATGARRQKAAVFIATPDTVDVDSLIDGLVEAEKAGVQVEVDVEVIRSLWEASRRRRVLEALEEAPMPVDVLAQALGIPLKRAQSAVQWLLSRGYLVYIHTPYGRVYAPKHAVDKLYRLHGDYLNPEPGLEVQVRPHTSRGPLRAIRGDYHKVKERLERLLEKHGALERLAAHARLRLGAVETIAQAAYNYRIDDKHTLKLVLDNLFSIRRWHRFHALNNLN